MSLIRILRASGMRKIDIAVSRRMILAILLVLVVSENTEVLAQAEKVAKKTAEAADLGLTYSLSPGSTLPGAGEFQRGWRLDKGIGEKVDHNRACAAYRNAMVSGHPLALAAYGFLLFKGDVEGNDPFRAEQICRASVLGVEELANKGDPTALALFGRLILNDYHPRRWSVEKPSHYYKKAAEKGDPYGQMLYAHLFLDSKSDVGENIPIALMWYQKAVSQDYSEAYHSLAMAMQRNAKNIADFEKVATLLRKASDRDVVQAQIELADWYRDGTGGLKRDYEAAWKLTVRAAELGDYDSMKAMARHHQSREERNLMWKWDEKANNLRKANLQYGKALADRDRKFDLKQYLAEERETIARENADANRRANPSK